jgi:RNA polymerase sigma-70 factor (ECF subfamily)
MVKAEEPISDQMLLASFQNEKLREAAFTKLVRKYQERLYWHIRRMVVTHEDTNDILQNVFIKVWKGLGGFREESGLYTWLYKVATNETLTWLQQQKKNTTSALPDAESFLLQRLCAQKDFDSAKVEWKLQQAILSLPEKQRLVFNLRYYDEMPYARMAELLETSEGALKASYHHAAKKVESILLSH